MNLKARSRIFLSFLLAISLCTPVIAFADEPYGSTIDETAVEATIEAPDVSTAPSDGLLVVLDDQQTNTEESTVEVPEANNDAAEVSENAVIESLESIDVEVIQEIAGSTEEGGTILKVTTPKDRDLHETINEISQTYGVSFVQPNYEYSLLEDVEENNAFSLLAQTDLGEGIYATMAVTTNDTLLNKQYYLSSWTASTSARGVGAFDAWGFAQSKGGTTIAVLDTGARIDHEDIAANLNTTYMWDAYNQTAKGTITSSNVRNGDNHGHGTHVAGIAAGTADNNKGIAGVSYNAKVLPIKVFSNESASPKCTTETLVRAYKYLVDLVKQGKLTNLRLINLSLGNYGTLSSGDLLLKDQIETARYSHNILTVCAGGNGKDKVARTDIIYPADFEACIAVTALNANGTNALFSDYNENKDISAPGESILSTYNSTTSTYAFQSGTSMASPLVSGCLSLLWAKHPQLNIDEALDAIYRTANVVITTSNDRTKPDANGVVTGSHGAINVGAAVNYVTANYVNTTKTHISSCAVTSIGAQSYTGSAIKPEPAVTYKGKKLVKGIDYTLNYDKNIDIGKGGVLVAGKGNYYGIMRQQFPINTVSVSKATVTGINSSYTYTGQSIQPNLVVKLNGKTLTKGTDYAVSISNNINLGTAEVTLTGIGNYAGTLTKSFKIVSSIPGKFRDVDAELAKSGNKVWYVSDGWLDYVVVRGIMSGYASSANFGPYDSITRGQVAVVLHRVETGETATTTDNGVTTRFSDVPSGQYYTAAVRWASEVGIVTGYGDSGLFMPDSDVTREELATMVARFAKECGGIDTSKASSSKYNELSGSENTNHWAKSSLVWCVDKGIIGGVSDKYLDPQGRAWRSAMAKITTVTLRDVLKW